MGFTDGRKITGIYRAAVLRSAEVTPHMVRVTFGGEDMRRLPARGFDQWFRLFLPRPDGDTDFTAVPEGFGIGGYLKYLAAKSGTRPPFRNYTVRELRSEAGELDVDFVSHGDTGIAGPWARTVTGGEQVVLLDQGRGFDPRPDTGSVLLVGDESALPALAGILRDLPSEAKGLALIEVPSSADEQELPAPGGVEVRFLARRDAGAQPGLAALAEVLAFTPAEPARMHAYLAGEHALVTGARRHLAAAGVPKDRIDFTPYWRLGRSG